MCVGQELVFISLPSQGQKWWEPT